MKRYKLNELRFSGSYGLRAMLTKNSNGDWVKWKDHKKAMDEKEADYTRLSIIIGENVTEMRKLNGELRRLGRKPKDRANGLEVENMKLEHEIQDRMREICTLTQNADVLNAENIKLKAGLRSANDLLSTYHDRPTNITVEIGGKEFYSKVAEICDEVRVKAARRRAEEDIPVRFQHETECNCTKNYWEKNNPSWVCPKHGYKKR